MTLLLNMTPLAQGLSGVYSQVVNNWIGPLFLILVAGVSITFIMRREFRQLISFLVIAVIVALLVFAGEAFFGSGGSLTNVAKREAQQINTIIPQVQMLLPLL